MALRTSLAEKKTRIDRYTMGKVAADGVENFSIRGLCKDMGLSAPSLYEVYVGKEDLLTGLYHQASSDISRIIARELEQAPQEYSPQALKDFFWRLWNQIWDFFMEDADRTLFMWRFYTCSYHVLEMDQIYSTLFRPLQEYIQRLDGISGASRRADLTVMLEGVYAYTLNAAAQVLGDAIPLKEMTLVTVFRMALLPLMEALGVEKVTLAL